MSILNKVVKDFTEESQHSRKDRKKVRVRPRGDQGAEQCSWSREMSSEGN